MATDKEREQARLQQQAMPLMDHLREMRTRLIRTGMAVAAGVVLCFFFAPDIWAFLVAPMNDALRANDAGTMAILAPLEGVVTYLKVAVVSGFFVATPIIAWQLWSFVAPGLYASERKIVLPLVFASTGLFVGGAAFGYFVIFKYAFGFFLSVTAGTAEAVMSMEAYLKTATRLLLAFGLSFQLPVVVLLLARIGLIDARDMIHGFKYSIVAIFVVAAVITPPDILTQSLMAAPLILLYGVGIVIAAIVSTKKRE